MSCLLCYNQAAELPVTVVDILGRLLELYWRLGHSY